MLFPMNTTCGDTVHCVLLLRDTRVCQYSLSMRGKDIEDGESGHDGKEPYQTGYSNGQSVPHSRRHGEGEGEVGGGKRGDHMCRVAITAAYLMMKKAANRKKIESQRRISYPSLHQETHPQIAPHIVLRIHYPILSCI